MLIDSHLHIPHEKYTKPVEQLINEAKQEGIQKFITIGTSIDESKKALEIAEKYKEVFATAGIYPHDDIGVELDPAIVKLQNLIDSSDKVKGIGECGIDITDWKGGRTIEEQIELFEKQIQLAIHNNLPIVIHNRNGNDIVISMLEKYSGSGLKGVAHCFVGDWDLAEKYLTHGFYISFSGIITYPSGQSLLETVEKVPLDKFLVETDAPYLAPQEHRGETNEPKYVRITAQKAAAVKKISFEEVCRRTYENTSRLFCL